MKSSYEKGGWGGNIMLPPGYIFYLAGNCKDAVKFFGKFIFCIINDFFWPVMLHVV